MLNLHIDMQFKLDTSSPCQCSHLLSPSPASNLNTMDVSQAPRGLTLLKLCFVLLR